MQKYTKSHLVDKNKLHKHSVITGTPSRVSRVLTLLDVITLIKKDVPAAIVGLDKVITSKVHTLLSWVEGIGLQNQRNKVATYDDAVEMIIAAGGTINLDLDHITASGSGIALTTTEAKTIPSYHSGTIPNGQTSEFITYTEMIHLMNNSTFA